MIANNIFRAIGNFFTNVGFKPYDAFRFTDGWWASNIFNTLLVIIGFIAMFYWLGQMMQHSKSGDQR